MGRFVELRFGQGHFGDDLCVQREIIPVDSIVDMFVVLPDKRNIQMTWKVGDRMFTRTEYYKNVTDCLKRWCFLRKACGMTAREISMNPVPLAMDANNKKEE